MRILHYSITFLLSLLICSSLDATNAKRPWTFFVYIAADNNLNPEADRNLSQMVKASSNENIYIVVHLNIKRHNEEKKTQKLLIQNGKITQIGATTAEDSGDYKTLLNALKWVITDFPSDYLAVDIWNHGSGPLNRNILAHRGVCYDDSTGSYMTDTQYKGVFDIIVNQYRGGKKIDIISFDACLMANIEIAYALSNSAHYLVASQQTVPGAGFNYTQVLSIMSENTPDPTSFARWMVQAYDNTYKGTRESYTLSAIDLTKLSPAISALNNIARQLLWLLKHDYSKNLIKSIRTHSKSPYCPHFDEDTYIDLYTFIANLYTHITYMGLATAHVAPFKKELKAGLMNIAQCVSAHVHSADFAKARGLSIYFADAHEGIEPSYESTYWTTTNTPWLDFLEEYLLYA